MHDDYMKRGIPTDFAFSIRPAELDSGDWCMTFDLEQTDDMAILIERVIHNLKDSKHNDSYSIDDIIRAISEDKRSSETVKDAALNRFMNAKSWGLFLETGTPVRALVEAGKIIILDLSCYSAMPNSWSVKALVIGIVSKKLVH